MPSSIVGNIRLQPCRLPSDRIRVPMEVLANRCRDISQHPSSARTWGVLVKIVHDEVDKELKAMRTLGPAHSALRHTDESMVLPTAAPPPLELVTNSTQQEIASLENLMAEWPNHQQFSLWSEHVAKLRTGLIRKAPTIASRGGEVPLAAAVSALRTAAQQGDAGQGSGTPPPAAPAAQPGAAVRAGQGSA